MTYQRKFLEEIEEQRAIENKNKMLKENEK